MEYTLATCPICWDHLNDLSADVRERLNRKIPQNRALVIHVSETRILREDPLWDERKFSLAAWTKLHEVFKSTGLFREVRRGKPADLLFETVVINAAPAEGMSGSLLKVKGRLWRDRNNREWDQVGQDT